MVKIVLCYLNCFPKVGACGFPPYHFFVPSNCLIEIIDLILFLSFSIICRQIYNKNCKIFAYILIVWNNCLELICTKSYITIKDRSHISKETKWQIFFIIKLFYSNCRSHFITFAYY